MNIAVVGTGYVGLVTAACLAELGHTVYGVDIDEKKIRALKRGTCPIYEPGLEELMRRGRKEKRLSFTTNLLSILPKVQVLFSAVATPPGKGHHADLKAVFSVAHTVGKHADHDMVFVNKSTVPVGTGKRCEELIRKYLKQRGVSYTVPVVSNPEFLREGMAVPDTLMPERIVVGINDDQAMSYEQLAMSQRNTTTHSSQLTAHSCINARALMEDIYRPITRVGKPLLFMSRESAELVKYASNTYLATKISLINMLSDLAERTGANIRDIARGIGLDSRIGPRFLHAGIGYGGSCFPKDVRALIATGKAYRVPMPIAEAVEWVNQHQRQRFVKKILSSLPRRATIAVWGLSFKPKTDDLRDAPSLLIIPELLKHGHSLCVFDPAAMPNASRLLPRRVVFASSPLDAARKSDAVVLLTEWDVFRGIDLRELKKTMHGNDLFDGRNVYEPEEVEAAGLKYHGIGMGL